jgi:hypothetical protein
MDRIVMDIGKHRSVRTPFGRRAGLGLLAAPLLAACVPGTGGGAQGSAGSQTGPGTADAPPGSLRVQTVVPNTDLAVGRNRFSLGVLNVAPGTTSPVPVSDAKLTLRFFHPIEPQPVAKGEATPEFRFVDDKLRGLFVAQVEFDQPGDWGVEVTGTSGDKPLTITRSRFAVKPKSDTPAIGSPVPRSHNPTRFDVDDIRKIDSGQTPNDMHDLSIAGALDEGKPLVVLFASPGFCVSQTCAPQLGEIQKLKAKFASQVNFVHIEIFKDPMSRTPFETVVEWGLTSEPWTFMVDRKGLMAEKFEGPAPFGELDAALQKLL